MEDRAVIVDVRGRGTDVRRAEARQVDPTRRRDADRSRRRQLGRGLERRPELAGDAAALAGGAVPFRGQANGRGRRKPLQRHAGNDFHPRQGGHSSARELYFRRRLQVQRPHARRVQRHQDDVELLQRPDHRRRRAAAVSGDVRRIDGLSVQRAQELARRLALSVRRRAQDQRQVDDPRRFRLRRLLFPRS